MNQAIGITGWDNMDNSFESINSYELNKINQDKQKMNQKIRKRKKGSQKQNQMSTNNNKCKENKFSNFTSSKLLKKKKKTNKYIFPFSSLGTQSTKNKLNVQSVNSECKVNAKIKIMNIQAPQIRKNQSKKPSYYDQRKTKYDIGQFSKKQNQQNINNTMKIFNLYEKLHHEIYERSKSINCQPPKLKKHTNSGSKKQLSKKQTYDKKDNCILCNTYLNMKSLIVTQNETVKLTRIPNQICYTCSKDHNSKYLYTRKKQFSQYLKKKIQNKKRNISSKQLKAFDLGKQFQDQPLCVKVKKNAVSLTPNISFEILSPFRKTYFLNNNKQSEHKQNITTKNQNSVQEFKQNKNHSILSKAVKNNIFNHSSNIHKNSQFIRSHKISSLDQRSLSKVSIHKQIL